MREEGFILLLIVLSLFTDLTEASIKVNDGESIQNAIDTALPGDTIFVSTGKYIENLIINKSIHLIGDGKSFTFLYGSITIIANDVEIKGFTIQNSSIGIKIINCNNITIHENTFRYLNQGLIVENNSSIIRIFHNNFIDNLVNALDKSNNKTFWDYNGEGNYWSDYNGTDADGDGIGDIPYMISTSMDHYPLMRPVTIVPIADFTFNPILPTTSDIIQFLDNSSDPDGFIIGYSWSFGDGNTSNERNPMHKYADDGLYNVTLKVIDDYNVSTIIVKQILVLNLPPHASFTYTPINPTDIDTVIFNDTSFDTDGVIVSRNWFVNDTPISNESLFTYAFPDDGVYTVTMIVYDDDGANSSYSKSITVRNVPPIPSFTYSSSNVTVYEGANVRFHDTSTDPDGNITSWYWSFSDDGSTSNERNPSHIFKEKGVYKVTLTVMDDDGIKETFSKKVTVFGAVEDTKFFTGLSIFDIIFIVFIIIMVFMVIILTRKYGR
ncbi:MAG: hypothetical protein DRN12_06675 [Thermoplasmata archaeon]|nr:MAG: hypothetical protein DRN12_06675 [Thermoplasmata archaeon]